MPYRGIGYVDCIHFSSPVVTPSEYIKIVCAERLHTAIRIKLRVATTEGVPSFSKPALIKVLKYSNEMLKLTKDKSKYVRMWAYQYQDIRYNRLLEWWQISLRIHKNLSEDTDPQIRIASLNEAKKSAAFLVQYETQYKNRIMIKKAIQNKLNN